MDKEKNISKLRSTNDIVRCLNKGQQDSNNFRVYCLDNEPMQYFSLNLPIERQIERNFLTITDVSCFYNFQISKDSNGII